MPVARGISTLMATSGSFWNGDGLQTEQGVDNNCIFILGQDQDNYGGDFEQDQSFFR